MTYGMPCDMLHMDTVHKDQIRAVGIIATSDTRQALGVRDLQKPLYRLFWSVQIDSVHLTAFSKFIKPLNAY